MITSPILDALDAVARTLETEGQKWTIEDGRFYLKFLGLTLNSYQDDSVAAWGIVRERIDLVFGPDLLNWNLIGQKHTHAKRRQSSLFPRASNDCFRSLLDNDEPTVEEDVTFYALVAILTLFISAVHDQKVQIYSILEKLKDSQQEKLERFFRYLLENRKTMTKEKLKILLSSASPAPSSQAGFSTPQSHRSNLGGIASSLSESFTYSPNSAKPSSPLQDFLQNHRNQQLFEKLQAELREVKSSLDHEKSDSVDLRHEVSELTAANEKLKADLHTTKSKLFKKTNGQHHSTTTATIELEELQEKYSKKTSDLKESEKYSKSLGTRVEQLNQEIEDLIFKNQSQTEKLNEQNGRLTKYQDLVGEFQQKIELSSAQNKELQQIIDALRKEIRDQQDVTDNRHSRNATFDVLDISMDNPNNILSPPRGETMGEIVTLQLRQEIDNLKDQNASLTTLYEKEKQCVEDQKQVEAKLKVNLETSNNEKRKLQTEVKKMTHEKDAVAKELALKESEILEFNSKLVALTETVEEKTSEELRLQIEIKNLQTCAESTELELACLNSEYKKEKDSVQILNGKIESSNIKISSLEVEVNKLTSKNHATLEELNFKHKENLEITEINATLSCQLEKKNECLENLKVNMETSNNEKRKLQTDIEKMTDEKNTMAKELDLKESYILEYNSKLAALTDNVEEKTSEELRLQIEIKNLQASVESTEVELAGLNTTYNKAKESIQILNGKIESSNIKISSLEVEVGKLTAENHAAMEELNFERQQNLEKTAENASLESQFEKKNEYLENMKVLMESSNNEKRNLQAKIEKMTDEKNIMAKELDLKESDILEYNSKLAALTENVEEKTSEELRLQIEIKNLQASVESTEVELAGLNTTYNKAKESIQILNGKIESSNIKISSLEVEVGKLTSENHAAMEELNFERQQNLEKTAQNASLESQFEKKNEYFENMKVLMESSNNEKRNLQAKIEEMADEKNTMAKELISKESEILEFNSKLAALKETVEERTTKEHHLQIEIKNLQASRESTEVELACLNTKYIKEKESVQILNDKIESSNIKISSLEVEVAKLTSKTNATVEELNFEKQQNLEKTAQIATLASQYEKNMDCFENLKCDVETSNNEKIKLQSEVDKMTDEKRAIVKELALKESEIIDCNNKLAALTETMEEKTSETIQLKRDIGDLENNIGSLKNLNETLTDDLKNEVQKVVGLKESLDKAEQKTKDELASQKQRYEAKVKSINDTLQGKYKHKLEEAIEKWKNDREKMENKFKEELSKEKENAQKHVDRYIIAKRKLEEMVQKMKEVTFESESKIANFIEEIKSLRQTIELLERKIRELEERPSSEKLFQENQTLQNEVKKLRNETRILQVQNDAADKTIRELKKSSRSTSALPPATANKKDDDGFIMPSQKNTPGRSRATRTQSEVNMGRTRPPQGSGSIFAMHEEDGEMFSSSYLSDMKLGICAVDNSSGRISELARRNTMQPAHLKSSYPAETQLRPPSEFTDDDLRNGRIERELEEATANLSVDSPANNTRRKSFVKMNISTKKNPTQTSKSPAEIKTSSTTSIPKPTALEISPPKRSKKPTTNKAVSEIPKIEISPPKHSKKDAINTVGIPKTKNSPPIIPDTPPQHLGLRPRKRPSLSQSQNIFDNVNFEHAHLTKKPRKDISYYSKPGPATPASKRQNRSINNSLNKSSASNQSVLTTGSNDVFQTPAKAHDKTPLLDTTNKSNRSNRSMKSLRSTLNTPLSLKKVMTRAFRKDKSKYDVKKKLDTPLKEAL